MILPQARDESTAGKGKKWVPRCPLITVGHGRRRRRGGVKATGQGVASLRASRVPTWPPPKKTNHTHDPPVSPSSAAEDVFNPPRGWPPLARLRAPSCVPLPMGALDPVRPRASVSLPLAARRERLFERPGLDESGALVLHFRMHLHDSRPLL